jgi:hypothetical protein
MALNWCLIILSIRLDGVHSSLRSNIKFHEVSLLDDEGCGGKMKQNFEDCDANEQSIAQPILYWRRYVVINLFGKM